MHVDDALAVEMLSSKAAKRSCLKSITENVNEREDDAVQYLAELSLGKRKSARDYDMQEIPSLSESKKIAIFDCGGTNTKKPEATYAVGQYWDKFCRGQR